MDENTDLYESRKDAFGTRDKFVKFWLDSIAASDAKEKHWREEAEKCVRAYRGHDKGGDNLTSARPDEFNIFHSNVETILPAIYNSTPVPDVRRRFGDKDKAAKVVSQMLERAISFSVDSYDFDETMRCVLFDGMVPGRGVARVRYKPYADDDQVTYQEVSCEYVHWSRIRIGMADTWDEVPWIAFEHFLSREELAKLAPGKAKDVQLDCKLDGSDADEDDPAKVGDVWRRARVWEIWDKETKSVIFIATGLPSEPLLEEQDQLELQTFFPIPKPFQPILTPGNLTPVCPYSIYRSLVEELNEVQLRIKRLTKICQAKGAYAAGADSLQRLVQLEDGELAALEGVEAAIGDNGGLDKAIIWWPIEQIAKVLQILAQQREQIKQTIYEVTGLSDILRGASKASETATAQEIKNQWGSQRIQRAQWEVQRFARDLFRIKAELIAQKFEPQTLMMITGVKLLSGQEKQMAQMQMQQAQATGQPPQLPPDMVRALEEPSVEEVFGLMQSDEMRSFRIDVESESTIRADLTRHQKQMNEFLQGTAQFVAAVGPAVQAGQLPEPLAMEIYTSFARNFKLGKQAEDALEKASEGAAKPKPPKPDPEMQKAQMQMQMEQQKAQQQAQIEQQKMAQQQQADAAKMELEAQKAANDAALAREKMAADIQLKREEMQMRMEIEREKAAQDLQLAQMKAQADIEIKREMASQQAVLGAAQADHKMEIDAKMADAKAKQAKQTARKTN